MCVPETTIKIVVSGILFWLLFSSFSFFFFFFSFSPSSSHSFSFFSFFVPSFSSSSYFVPLLFLLLPFFFFLSSSSFFFLLLLPLLSFFSSSASSPSSFPLLSSFSSSSSFFFFLVLLVILHLLRLLLILPFFFFFSSSSFSSYASLSWFGSSLSSASLFFVTSCARNHYFYSGFRHTSKNHPSVRAWNHCKNSGFRHSTPKHAFILELPPFWGSAGVALSVDVPETTIFTVVPGTSTRTTPVCGPETTIKIVVSGTAQKSMSRRAEPKKWDFCAFFSRFAEAHRDPSESSRFVYFYARRPETPIFVVFSGHQKNASSKMHFFEKV